MSRHSGTVKTRNHVLWESGKCTRGSRPQRSATARTSYDMIVSYEQVYKSYRQIFAEVPWNTVRTSPTCWECWDSHVKKRDKRCQYKCRWYQTWQLSTTYNINNARETNKWVGIKTWYENPDPILWHMKFQAAAFIRLNVHDINAFVFSCSTSAFRFTVSGTGILGIRAIFGIWWQQFSLSDFSKSFLFLF